VPVYLTRGPFLRSILWPSIMRCSRAQTISRYTFSVRFVNEREKKRDLTMSCVCVWGGGWRLITVTRGIGIKLTKGKQKKKADGIKTRLLDTEPTYKRREWLCSKAAVKQSNNINDFHDSIVWIISEFLVYRYDPQFCVLKLSNFCKIWRSYSGDQQDHITEHNTHLLSILNVSVSYKKTC